jgi:uncharacterized protein (TIGR03437 family)
LQELLQRLNASSRVLDLGCGPGSFSYDASPARILALDEWLFDSAEAGRRMAGGRIHYLIGSGLNLPLASASVDLVVANHVFEHVEDPRKTAGEVSRVLNGSGALFASVPDGFAFSDNLYRWCTGGGGHLQRYTYRGLQQAVESETDLRLLCSFPLYSSFVYLNSTPEAASHLSQRYQRLASLPRAVQATLAVGANLVLRTTDALLGTRLSFYGWGFYFGKPEAHLDAVPSEVHINVCAFCGTGHSGGWLDALKKVRRRFVLPSYACETCGRANPYFGRFHRDRILRTARVEEELLTKPSKSPAVSDGLPTASPKPQIFGYGDLLTSSKDLSPGTLVVLKGRNLARDNFRAPENEWPLEAGGVRVLLNGRPSPLGEVSPERIVFQAPFSTARGETSLVVEAPDGTTVEEKVFFSLAAPGLPSVDQSGKGRGKFSHPNWAPVTSADPARPGAYVAVWAIGLGPVAPPPADGIPAPVAPLTRTTRQAFLRVGGQLSEVEYCGLSPGSVGYYQLNFVVPKRLAPGEHDVYLEIGGARSNVVTIPVGRRA